MYFGVSHFVSCHYKSKNKYDTADGKRVINQRTENGWYRNETRGDPEERERERGAER